jgi:ParB-like chromosome segregation protein Spo0J
MKVELWPVARVKPYPNNPRLNDDAVAAVAASIREFGFRQPIVVDSKGVLVCGHTRWKAAQMLGLEKAPVHVAKDLRPEQIKAYRIAHNQTASLAEWDYDLLPIELREFAAANYDLGLLGFHEDELAERLDPGLRDDGRVPRQDRGAGPDRRRMEAASRARRQPLARLPSTGKGTGVSIGPTGAPSSKMRVPVVGSLSSPSSDPSATRKPSLAEGLRVQRHGRKPCPLR